MEDRQFDLLLNKIEKIDDRLHEYNTIANNDNKHIVADISAIKVKLQGLDSAVKKLCGKDTEFNNVLIGNSKTTTETATILKLVLQVLLPAITLIVGMFIQSKF